MRALQEQAQTENLDLELVGLGGEKMAAAGLKLLADTAAIGSVGLTESLQFIFPTWKIQQKVKRYLRQYPIDLLVLIDYMGPNLSIASYLRKAYPRGCPLFITLLPKLGFGPRPSVR